MPWLQLIAEIPKQSIDKLENCLLNAGAVSVSIQEYIPPGQKEQPILEPNLGETPLWDSTRVIGLFDAHIDTKKIDWLLKESFDGDTAPSFYWEQLEDKDWEREWMQNYHPIEVTDSLWICPSWQTPPKPEATNLLLDPGLAFGTGTHPTTFLCMQWLAEQDLKDKTLIDYGCGSGILGITAILLGAKKVIGIDIDPQALIATQDNLKRNHLSAEQFPVFLPDKYPKLEEKAHIVVANILAGPLVELSHKLIDLIRPNGMICLSGILQQQASKVEKAYSQNIEFETASQKDEWVKLSGVKMARL
jgi:ribosomal protein L11 methyltransferase